MGEERNPVAVFAPESPAAVAYSALWSEIEQRLRPELEAASEPEPEESEAKPAEQVEVPAAADASS